MEALANDDHNQKINRVAILEEIKRLHSEVDGSVLECWRKNLPKMILLGEALTTLKSDVEQGKWLEWYRANAGYCGFSEDTAERYMRLYRNRELLQQPDSAHVRNLTDALILIKEPDPDKRKALLDEAARTGESIRSAKKRAKKGQKPLSDPKSTAAIDGLTVLGIRYEVAAQWVEMAQGDTVEALIKDALRLHTLAREIPGDAPPDTQAPQPTIQPQEVPSNDSVLADPTESLVPKPPDVKKPEPPIESPEAPNNDSDPADPAEPLVSVEQPEKDKRHPYMDGIVLHRKPKPYNLRINDPSEDGGWLAAYTQLGIDGPTYFCLWDRLLKEAIAVLTTQLSARESDERSTEETCFQEFQRLIRQFNIKLRGDQYTLEKLRKRMRKLLGPDIWEEFANESELIEAGEELVNLPNDP